MDMKITEELLDIVDENGQPVGEIIDRKSAHEKGIRHRTSHVWILRRKEDDIEILLQKRSDRKDSYPGCYDISSAGHIPAGEEFVPSALRELKEELGVTAAEDDLVCCGQRSFQFQKNFHGRMFRDNQVSNVYLLWLDWEERDFILQEEEVSEVRWMKFSDCMEAVRENRISHCIFLEELNMIAEHIKRQDIDI